MLRNLCDWIVGHVVRDVPEDVGLCEFDCRRPDCSAGELELCERRLCRAKGELMPGGRKSQEPAG